MNLMKKRFSLRQAAGGPKTRAGCSRIACVVRFLLLLLALSAAAHAQDFTYTTNNDTITITGYTGPGGLVTIPVVIDGLAVTRIGDGAFYACSGLTHVAIPNSVTNIGNWAFYGCTSLTNSALPNSVTSIGDSAFRSCFSLTSLTISNGVTSIGNHAFFFCRNLASITISESVTSIGTEAFADCPSLNAIMVDAHNLFYSSVDGVLFNKDQSILIQYPGGKSGAYNFPNQVRSIGDWAFGYCSVLTSLTLNNSITNIGDGAFYGSSLVMLTIGDGLAHIGNLAFCACYSLASVNLPDTVATIGDNAFKVNINLTNITLGKGVTSIGSGAFSWCSSLTSIVIPAKVTSLEDTTFQSCSGLTAVFFQTNAPRLGSFVFDGADNATVYYLAGTRGWRQPYGGRPVMQWNPQIQVGDIDFGVIANQFGFTSTGVSDSIIVVEAATNLTTPLWLPVGTNTLTNGSAYFSDPGWTNQPGRFYRLRSP